MPIIYINWNPDPELLSLGSFSIRWYGVLFAAGFFIGYFIVKDFFKREGLSMKLLDKLATYLVIATVVGAEGLGRRTGKPWRSHRYYYRFVALFKEI